MNATPVSQKELVKLLVLEHGQKRASELANVPYEKVRKWTQRGKWLSSQNVPNTVAATVERISDTLAEHERETRLSLARYARSAAKHAEQATLRDAPLVHKAAQVAGLVHKWDSEKSGNQFTLNILNINSLENRLGGEETVIDTE